MTIARLLALTLLSLAHLHGSAATAARAETYTPPVTVTQRTVDVHVRADGSATTEVRQTLRIDTEQAVESHGEFRFNYSSRTENFEVLEAWTVTPDGQRLDVAPEKIRTLETSDTGEPSFSDGKVRVVIFPAVGVGAQLGYRVRREQHTPDLPGHFFDLQTFSPHRRVEAFEYRLSHEPGIALRVGAGRALHQPGTPGPQGGRVQPLPTDAPGTMRYRYVWRQDQVLAPLSGRVALSDFSAWVGATSFADYAAVGQAYQASARPQAEPTPEIRALAQRLTEGATDDRDKVRRLHHWVSRHIRYVALELDSSGYVPRAAQHVLEHRFGDCKDHVALLEALLRAVGVDSTPALVNLGNSHRLPPLPMPMFDHVITYVPSLDLYLDATAQFAPLGTLPDGADGKPVLHTASGAVTRTPAPHPDRNGAHTRTTLQVQPDGSVTGRSVVRARGTHEVDSRAWHHAWATQAMDEIVRTVLAGHQETGTGRITHPAPADLDTPWQVQAEFTLDPVINLPGLAAMTVPVGVADGHLRGMRTLTADPTQPLEYECSSMRYLEETTIEFPPSATLWHLPPDVTIQHGPLRYEARWRQQGQTVEVRREFVSHFAATLCGAKEELAWEAVLPVMRRDLRGQVFVR
jgi:transglutaminase-like putative cysteine protease